ncbi:MAG: glycine cleavage system aminomethyltransferase GcvT [Acidimicrobiia bacterium]|nr:glycine cleavage system aminomethyltransferase GcvT [Acidimicrobiia bacterium]
MSTTPIRASHEACGARFTDFGGWEMPLQYEGVIAEHNAVRSSAGMFDVSHLGRFEVSGAGALSLLREMLCNDIAKIEPGRAQYTMALTEDGGVEDDIIVWWIDEERFWVMPNGVNFSEIMQRFQESADDGTVLRAVREQTVLLAVQGPEAPGIVESVLGAKPGRFRVERGNWGNDWYIAAGTGYTGERGAEICVAESDGAKLWEALLAAGAVPCGLGARDTLRLEMGYPLWGQDLDESTSPLEAGLNWVVDWDHDFVGKNALEAQKAAGPTKKLVSFTVEGRRPPRPGYPMRSGGSTGTITSGNFSPSLGYGIGMGYMAPPPATDHLEIDMRGTWTEAKFAQLPFLPR